MPELPEVETVVRSLRGPLCGRRIRSLEILDAKLDFPGRVELAGAGIAGVTRRGKFILLALSGREECLQIHLRMTGRLLLAAESYRSVKADRALFHLDEGMLVFQDMRRFGTFHLADPAVLEKKLGPEPLGPEFTVARFRRDLAGRKAPIKPLLLDQRLVAGIGNIYASEALFQARIHPARPAGELRGADVKRLHAAVREILQRAVEALGTTYSTYLDGEGRAGTFQNELRVFQRQGEACPVCADEIRRIVQAGRSTFYCPTCQH